MNTKTFMILGLALLFSAVPTWASLNTVTISSAGMGAAGSAKIYGGGNNGVTISTGLLKYDVINVGGTGNLFKAGSKIGVFCIDLAQKTTKGATTFDVIDPAEGPRPVDFLNGPMGSQKADLLSELWGRYYDSAWLTSKSYTSQQKDAAEAFQLCIWEIVYEGCGNDLDIERDGTSGSLGFKAKKTNFDLAASMLSSLDGTGPKANIVTLSDMNSQDFITATACEVPEPATIAMLGLGMVVLARAKRR